MLRKNEKTKILKLIDTMQQVYSLLKGNPEDEAALQDCQAAAIAIGTALEQQMKNPKPIVSLLEQYCEDVYELAQDTGNQELPGAMNLLLAKIKKLIKDEQAVYQMVFMPYKAQMWDSLESIWRACREDERCECLVVPIPYYEYAQVGNERRATLCYDGDLFPDDVPVTNYKDYHMAQERPDVVYIHNPFDQYNMVTSVHPDYYSTELKKYARLVVYSPYYVTSGFVSDHYLQLPSNQIVDYIIVQSQHAKEYYHDLPFYDKVLPFGSPKLDKVIRLCREKPQMPPEWKEIIGDRKSLMLNTSINCFLQQGDIYLKKLRHMFKWFKGRDDIAIIWRPHPLLESTIKSMRNALVEQYHELLDFFVKERIGVLDQTPDISVTVALSDGYVGETASSVINLFQVAGKPLFILNNLLYEPMPEEYKGRCGILDMVRVGDQWYVLTGWNGLYVMKEDWTQLHLEKTMENAPRFANLFMGGLEVIGNDIYFTPATASQGVCYHVNERRFETVFSQNFGKTLNFIGIAKYKNRIIYLPRKGGSITVYDAASRSLYAYSECVAALKGNEWDLNYEEITAWCVDEHYLYAAAIYTNRVLQLDMEKGSYRVYSVADETNGYTAITADKDSIWLAEAAAGTVIRCDKNMQIRKMYAMPQEWKCWKSMLGQGRAFGSLLDMGRWMVAVPRLSSSAVRIDKITGECRCLALEFFEGTDTPQNGYHPAMYFRPHFAKKLDETHFAVQLQIPEGRLAVVDVEKETCEVSYAAYDTDSFENLMNEQDGFEKQRDEGEFARRENMYFTLEDFVDDLVNDRLDDAMQRQKEAVRTITDNLDGTCGEHVHQFMISELSTSKIK